MSLWLDWIRLKFSLLPFWDARLVFLIGVRQEIYSAWFEKLRRSRQDKFLLLKSKFIGFTSTALDLKYDHLRNVFHTQNAWEATKFSEGTGTTAINKVFHILTPSWPHEDECFKNRLIIRKQEKKLRYFLRYLLSRTHHARAQLLKRRAHNNFSHASMNSMPS